MFPKSEKAERTCMLGILVLLCITSCIVLDVWADV